MSNQVQKQNQSIWSKGFNWLINNTYKQIPTIINSYQIKHAKPEYLHFQDYVRSPDLAREAGLLSIRQLRTDYIKRKQGIQKNAILFKKNGKIKKDDYPELLCPICLQIYNGPVTTSCSHTFCHMCLDQAILFNASCPVCRSQIRGQQWIVSKSIQKLIASITKSFQFQDLKKYVQKEYQYNNWINKRNISKKQIDVGDCIDVRDTQQVWCKATILQIHFQQNQRKSVLIHYEGWTSLYDEVVCLDSQRLAKFKFYTSRLQIPHYNLSVDNNQHLRSQIITGQNRNTNYLIGLGNLHFGAMDDIIESDGDDISISIHRSDQDSIMYQQSQYSEQNLEQRMQYMLRQSSLQIRRYQMHRNRQDQYNASIQLSQSVTLQDDYSYNERDDSINIIQNDSRIIVSSPDTSLQQNYSLLQQLNLKTLSQQQQRQMLQRLKQKRIKKIEQTTHLNMIHNFKNQFNIGDQWEQDDYYPRAYFRNKPFYIQNQLYEQESDWGCNNLSMEEQIGQIKRQHKWNINNRRFRFQYKQQAQKQRTEQLQKQIDFLRPFQDQFSFTCKKNTHNRNFQLNTQLQRDTYEQNPNEQFNNKILFFQQNDKQFMSKIQEMMKQLQQRQQNEEYNSKSKSKSKTSQKLEDKLQNIEKSMKQFQNKLQQVLVSDDQQLSQKESQQKSQSNNSDKAQINQKNLQQKYDQISQQIEKLLKCKNLDGSSDYKLEIQKQVQDSCSQKEQINEQQNPEIEGYFQKKIQKFQNFYKNYWHQLIKEDTDLFPKQQNDKNPSKNQVNECQNYQVHVQQDDAQQ